jgi:hypothetical protein
MSKHENPESEKSNREAVSQKNGPIPGTEPEQLIDKGEKTERPMRKFSVVIRHGTPYPKYHRAGLVLTQIDQILDVTELQFEVLKHDRWVIMHKIMTSQKGEKSE